MKQKPEKLPVVAYTWTGEAMVPIGNMASRTDKYVVGERYSLMPYDERSQASHNHYFLGVRAAWRNWPEDYPLPLANEEQLRKHALIRTGYYDQYVGTFDSAEEAARFAHMMMAQVEYAEYSIFDTAVVLRIAQTQKKKIMGNDAFQKSKRDVLDFFSAVLNVDVATLIAEAKRMAA